MIVDYKNELQEKGIVELDLDAFTCSNLLEIASCFGKVIPGARGEWVQLLSARDKGYGPVGSFSYEVGYDAFPWHTDTAYWNRPAHYLFLTSSDASPCATLYQSFDVIKEAIPDFDYLNSQAIFLLDVPGQKRYLSPRFISETGVQGLRLDFHIYRPMNEEAVMFLELVNTFLLHNYNRFLWTGHNAVIIDNWRFIHAREAAHEDKTRVLKRIYINELD